MIAAGAEMMDMHFVCGTWQYQRLMTIFGNPPTSTVEGGLELVTVIIPLLGKVKILYSPHMAADDLLFLDMAHYQPAFGLVPGKPTGIFVEETGRIAAGIREQLYGLFGIDYHNIIFHGAVTGLATS